MGVNNMVYVIADTHLGHKKIIAYEAEHRPFQTVEEHDEEIVRRWNEKVRPNDIVWHLGDVLFGAAAFATLGRLNGTKRLVMGNHDHYPVARYLEYFTSVHGCAVVQDCILSHVPVHPGQLGRFRKNIHGHLHSRSLDDPRYVNVSAEVIGLTPILMDVAIR